MRDQRRDVLTDLAQRIDEADETASFTELLRIAQLDPDQHLRYADWAGVSFKNCDLRGFDFTGAYLMRCDFEGALISGARFEHAAIDWTGTDPRTRGSRLRAARDWVEYVQGWTPPWRLPSDRLLRVGAIFQDAPFAPEMVVVPAGTFIMGTCPEELVELAKRHGEEYGKRVNDEGPQRPVAITSPLAVGCFVVTFEEWEAAQRHPEWRKYSGLKSRRPGDRKWGRGRRPVINVSWDDAQGYCRWLTVVTGKHYRIPTEAEWEYACRAGTATPYATGDSMTGKQARFYHSGGPVEVGSYPANAWGLHDMHGNVWEWCQDEWHESYDRAPDDGSAWEENATGGRRVVRGGSWLSGPQDLRSAGRGGNSTGDRVSCIGFRVARELSS